MLSDRVCIDPEFDKALEREIKKEHFSKKKKNHIPNGERGSHNRCQKSGKVCYSKVEAQTMVNAPTVGKKKLTGCYYCEFCGHYHVTSRKQS